MSVQITSDRVWCKIDGNWKQAKKPTPPAKIYAVDIAINVADPYDRVSYPQTVTINGQVYDNACYGYTPGSGTDIGSWAQDYDSGTGLISGIVPGTLNNSTQVFTPASTLTSIPAGSSSADAMTYFPTWYQYWDNDGTYIHIFCCNEQLTSDFKDYPGSIGTDRKGHFYLGCYTCISGYQSRVGTPLTNTSYQNFLNGCQSLGDNYDMMTWFQYEYLAMLCVFIWKSTDLQNAFAGGKSDNPYVDSNTALTTTQYGMVGAPGGFSADRMAFFWIEDLWGNMYQFVGGAHTNSSYKLELNTGLSSISTWDLQTGLGPNSAIYGYTLTRVTGTTESGFFPLASLDSDNTYFADRCGVHPNHFASVGCDYDFPNGAGPFCVDFNYLTSTSSPLYGSRLSYRG